MKTDPSTGPVSGVLKPVTALLIASAILMLGNGLNGVLLPLRAHIDGFSGLTLGLMGSAYYAGLLAGCIVCPRIIARVGHIRAFAAFTSIATATPLLHAMIPDPIAWSLLRALNGLAFAGLFMGIESWLTAASEPATRGRVLGLYSLVHLTVVTAGMQLIGAFDARGFELFSLVAILYSIAAVPVALTGSIVPVPPAETRLRLGWLLTVSPSAVWACLLAGVANSAFWTLSPFYGATLGLSDQSTALFLAAGVLMGALAQWPMGALSDRLGRRVPLAMAGLACCLAGLGLSYAARTGNVPLAYAMVLLYGAGAFPIYTLAVAHANDLVDKGRAVEVSGGLLLVFSIGATVGPLLAALWMERAGGGAIFLHTAIAHLLIAAIMIVRIGTRPVLSRQYWARFVLVPRSTPAVFGLDPRGTPAPAPKAAVDGDATPKPTPASGSPAGG